MENLPTFYIGAFVFIFGAMIGSFLNVVIFRIPIIMLTDLPEWGLKLQPDFIHGRYRAYPAHDESVLPQNKDILTTTPIQGEYLLNWEQSPVTFSSLPDQIEALLIRADAQPNTPIQTELTFGPTLDQTTKTLTLAYEDNYPAIPEGFLARLMHSIRSFGLNIWANISYIWTDFPREFKAALQAISTPPSHCFQCKNPVKWYDNLPILSWFILGGKCRHCGTPFSFRYPFIECLTAGLFVYGFGLTGLDPVSLGFLFYFIAILWAIFWIDLDHQFIFNVMTYPSIFLGIVYNVTTGTLNASLLGIVTAFAIFESIALLSIWLLRKEGMGGGDTKLAVLLGAWLGPEKLVAALALAFILGAVIGVLLLIIRKESKPFPFGPALVFGGLMSLSIGETLWAWYIGSIMW